MERQVWLAGRRAALAAAWDAEAATYGDEEYPWDTQREWVARVLGLIPPGGTVLDAPCGTGKYFAMLAAAGHRVAGADQSAGMPNSRSARTRTSFEPRHGKVRRSRHIDLKPGTRPAGGSGASPVGPLRTLRQPQRPVRVVSIRRIFLGWRKLGWLQSGIYQATWCGYGTAVRRPPMARSLWPGRAERPPLAPRPGLPAVGPRDFGRGACGERP